MKLNKKGFMLAEVVIVASVVTTILVSIYVALNRTTSAYETRNRYYDIDAMYVAMEINNIIKRTNPEFINNNSALSLSDDSLDSYNDFKTEYNKFISFYNAYTYTVDKVYYCPHEITVLNGINTGDPDFQKYREYLLDKLDFTDDSIKYLVIVELEKENGNKYYYTLKEENNTIGGTTNEENE